MSEVVAAEGVAPMSGGAFGIFRHRDFALFFGAAAISNSTAWMQIVAVQALLFDLTDSGGWLGLSTVVSLVPAVVLTPHAGVLADRVSRRAILQVTQTVQMAMALALFVLYVSDVVTPWWILLVGFVNGAATGIQTAAWQSFVPLLVPHDEMMPAVRLNSVQNTLARAVGPAVGGVILRIGGVGAAILSNAITYLLVIAVLVVVRPRVNQTRAKSQRVMAGLHDGARYMWRRRPLRLALLLALAGSTLGQSLQYIASAISERVFHHDSNGNAGLLTALGVGALCSSAIAVSMGDRLRRSHQVLASMVVFVVSIGALAAAHSYVIGELTYFLVGAAQLQLAVALNTLVQGGVPDEYRGRAMAFYLVGILGGIPLGSQLLGSLGDLIGFRTTLALDAIAFAVVGVALVVSGWWRDLDAGAEQLQHEGVNPGR